MLMQVANQMFQLMQALFLGVGQSAHLSQPAPVQHRVASLAEMHPHAQPG